MSLALRAGACALIAGVSLWAAWPGLHAPVPAGLVPPAGAAAADGAGAAQPLFASAIASAVSPPRVHAASVTELADGRLYATWFGGEREGGEEVKIYGARFDPASGAWGEQHIVASPESTSADLGYFVRKVGNPVTFTTPGGELWLVYVSVSMGGWATSHLNLMRSTDKGASWLPAQRLVTSPFFNLSTLVKAYPVFYANGDIGLPVYHEMGGKFAELLLLSPSGEVKQKVRMDHGRRSLQPVMLVQDEQRAVALLRYGAEESLYRAWRIETKDAGRSWSGVEATDLPNPNSALAALRMEDGRMLAVANDTEDERLRLSLLVSEDEGRHWRAIHRFEDRSDSAGKPLDVASFRSRLAGDLPALGPGPAAEAVAEVAERNLCRDGGNCSWQYDYPYLIQARNGDYHLVYTWNRSFVRHIRFNRAWLEERL
ncbi:hypothetical protein GRF61_09815 [Azoarcus sp. TTM-91]|uniref:sialidase family protein n=1 Tax=Azoarcus sp. TTM-91 TaxID=2691581 RepID=UPI00145DBFEB|nr:sialidase family protein [Azoarcus sp. TTM-91]NMG34738.1 hypothetical protein [Azoarcus sp. TTM-91]